MMDGVSGTEWRFLHGDRDPVERIGGRRRGDDDDRLRTELSSGLEHPVDHPPPEQRVEMLRDRRLHTRPETGRHDDGAEALRLRSGHRGWGARIRTWDHGTKTRCLTTWPRPRARSSCHSLPDRTDEPRASRVTETRGGMLGGTLVVEEPVDDRPGAADVGAERPERLELLPER